MTNLIPADLAAEWPETPLKGVKMKGRRCKETKLNLTALRLIVDSIETAVENELGTFHLPQYDNLKVKLDRRTGEHQIWVCLK